MYFKQGCVVFKTAVSRHIQLNSGSRTRGGGGSKLANQPPARHPPSVFLPMKYGPSLVPVNKMRQTELLGPCLPQRLAPLRFTSPAYLLGSPGTAQHSTLPPPPPAPSLGALIFPTATRKHESNKRGVTNKRPLSLQL